MLSTEMNDLDFIWHDIFDQFNDFYCDVALIVWAIKMDDLSSLVEQEPPPFNPLQPLENTNNHVFRQHPYAFLSTSHFDTYVPIAALSHSEDLLIKNKEKLCL